MKVSIHHQGVRGWVTYDPLNKEVMVSHPNELVRKAVRHYLNNEQKFDIPLSHNIGHKGSILKKPTEDKMYMLMALSQMYHQTGVHVDWGHSENIGPYRYDNVLDTPDPNTKADKPIVKSLFDDEDYEIIN